MIYKQTKSNDLYRKSVHTIFVEIMFKSVKGLK